MKVAVTEIPPMGDVSQTVNAIIEIPKGRRTKFEIDKRYGIIKLDRYLYASSHYPGDYGFVPQTLAEDGDALDIIVMVNEPTFPGCLIESRILGLFQMLDGDKRDDKLLAVPSRDPLFADYKDITHVPPHFLKEVEHFFLTYKQLEGSTIKSEGWVGISQALEVLGKSIISYNTESNSERSEQKI